MNILVLSDSHSGLGFMNRCISAMKPDRVIHLGDYVEDAQTMAEYFPQIPFTVLPGNCDRYRGIYDLQEIIEDEIEGVRFFMTHGHRHRVKQTTAYLEQDAMDAGADIVLYGHTHIADCRQNESGLWILNPGSCSSSGGSAGMVQVENGEIRNCRILRISDLEELL